MFLGTDLACIVTLDLKMFSKKMGNFSTTNRALFSINLVSIFQLSSDYNYYEHLNLYA